MNVLIHGIGGRMGKAVYEESKKAGVTVVAGVDALSLPTGLDCPLYSALDQVRETPDCVIDFSHHTAVRGVLDFCTARHLPAVLATTGYDEGELAAIEAAAAHVPLFRSGNMSVGVYVLQRLTALAAKLLPDADVEIIEQHHNQKLDAPSGTALMLYESAKNGREKQLVCGREGMVGKRNPDEIGMHSVRGGTVVGKHEVLFLMGQEVVTLKHEAESRTVFALGALQAARYLCTLTRPGLYNMSDMLAL